MHAVISYQIRKFAVAKLQCNTFIEVDIVFSCE